MRIPKRAVPAYAARQLHRVVGSGFLEVWGYIDQLPANKEAAFTRYRKLMTEPGPELIGPKKVRPQGHQQPA